MTDNDSPEEVSGKAGIPCAKKPVADYIAEACASFERDPPDSDFQDGYMAAVTTIRAEADLAVPAWRPIQTAPRDRTVIIGRDRYGNVFDCMFVSGDYFASVEGGDPCDYQDGWYRKNDDADEVCPYLWLPYPSALAEQVSA